MNTIAKVLEFHEAFGCAIGERPEFPPGGLAGHAMVGRMCLENALDAFKLGAAAGDPRCLRLALITEELHELAESCEFSEPVDALDALVDLRYVLDGTVIAFGFHKCVKTGRAVDNSWDGRVQAFAPCFDEAFRRVHDANMAKLHDGKPVHNETGKVIKPPGWVAPDLSDLIV
jgi:predicted HAD superfamily Cof-like phosphohydrolase